MLACVATALRIIGFDDEGDKLVFVPFSYNHVPLLSILDPHATCGVTHVICKVKDDGSTWRRLMPG